MMMMTMMYLVLLMMRRFHFLELRVVIVVVQLLQLIALLRRNKQTRRSGCSASSIERREIMARTQRRLVGNFECVCVIHDEEGKDEQNKEDAARKAEPRGQTRSILYCRGYHGHTKQLD